MKRIKKKREKTNLDINELELSCEVKNNIENFKSFISRLKKRHYIIYNNKFNIVIDHMSIKDIDVYLEVITNILIENNIVTEVIDYDFGENPDSVSYSGVIVNFDDSIPSYLKRSSESLIEFFSDYSKKGNVLIFTSYKDIDTYSSFKESNIIKNSPVYRISHKDNESVDYQNLIDKYETRGIKHDLSKDSFNKIYSNMQDNEYAKRFEISEYLYNYSIINNSQTKNDCVTIDSFKSIIKEEKKKEKDYIDLNSLTGLSNIKEEVNKLLSYAEFKKKINAKDSTYLNLFFLGNPGTGKTLTANNIADKLKDMGYLESNEVITIVPNDLIGEYVGQTRGKAREILNKAKGKLLFIDEAYLLYNQGYSKGNNPYMNEAMVELLKYLEDPKNIVIFAGYSNEMKKLYDINPGLKSRIYKEIEFDDYSNEELFKILKDDLNKQGLKLDNKSKKEFLNYIEYLKKEDNFGNARTILNLSQTLIMNHSSINSNSLIISKNDLPKDVKKTKRMGFDQ